MYNELNIYAYFISEFLIRIRKEWGKKVVVLSMIKVHGIVKVEFSQFSNSLE